MSNNYPTGDDLQAFATNAGVVTANADLSLDYGRVVAAAIKQWDSDTGWKPFVATTQTRYYDLPKSHILDLRGGLLSLTSVTVGTNTALVQALDFDLYPLNAATDGLPYEWIEFRRTHVFAYNRHAAVAVAGSFGRVTTVPDEVKHAILCNACVRLMPTKGNSATGMVTQIHQDEIRIGYATNVTSKSGLTPQQMQLFDQYQVTMTDYRRLRIT